MAGLKRLPTKPANQPAFFSGLKTRRHMHSIHHSDTKPSSYNRQKGTPDIFIDWVVGSVCMLPALWCKTSCFNLRVPTAPAIQRLIATR